MCHLHPSFRHGTVDICGNHEIGIEGEKDGLMARLAGVCLIVTIVPPWRQPQHGIRGGEGKGTVEAGVIGEQQALTDPVAYHIGTWQPLHDGAIVGIVEAVGIGRRTVQGDGLDATQVQGGNRVGNLQHGVFRCQRR